MTFQFLQHIILSLWKACNFFVHDNSVIKLPFDVKSHNPNSRSLAWSTLTVSTMYVSMEINVDANIICRVYIYFCSNVRHGVNTISTFWVPDVVYKLWWPKLDFLLENLSKLFLVQTSGICKKNFSADKMRSGKHDKLPCPLFYLFFNIIRI